MKKNKYLVILLALVLVLSACGKANDDEKLGVDKKFKIVTSFYPVYDFVSKIGGDKMEVINLTKSGSAHGFEPSVKDMEDIAKADLLVVNGAGFEGWLDKVSENNPDLDILDLSKSVDLIEADHDHHDHDHEEDHEDEDHENHDHEDHDHEDHDHHGHHHGKYNPHIWTSLDNAVDMMELICDKFSELDPQNKDYYQDNLDNYKKKFEDLDEKYEEALEDYQGRTIIVPHEAFAYLSRDYGLKQVGMDGVYSDGEPNIARIKEIVEFMKENDIDTVFYEYGKSDKSAKTIADEVGGRVLPISSIEVLTQEDIDNNKDYLSMMEMNLENILKSFKGE